MDEEVIEYEKGAVVFNQGDPGGDLYFIQKGRVQIYTTFAGKITPLSEMKEGEVLGTLTCLTNNERMASARAIEDLVVKKVSYQKISKLISNFPDWMKIVLKDFALRLEQMNQNYSKSAHHVELLSINQVNYFYTSAQLASAISACAPLLMKIVEDNIEAVFPEEIVEFLEPVLLKSKAELETIFEIFVECGMIRLRIEQEKKRKYFNPMRNSFFG